MKKDVIEIAKKTIALEAEAIKNLENYIDDSFKQVVELILKTDGRIIVTGIGKSAIIAQKMVATFNSTGSPALFMHAADAIHGDLGMIKKEDCVMVISKSGESPEIKALIPLVKSFQNKLIAVVGNIKSYLAKEADFVLNSYVEKEACANNLAPTSSTTAQMVLGDALAISLMEMKQFTGKDFAKFHPGGNLGKRLFLTAAEAAKNNEKPIVFEEDSIKEIIVEITKKRLGVTAVCNNQKQVVGIITDGDLRRMLETKTSLELLKAKDIASKKFKFIEEDMLAVNALQEFRKYDISQLLLFKNNEYVGVLHLHDLIREGIF